MRLEKSEQLLKLALMMQASTEGIGLQDIQEEFEVGRRTAERMRDALLSLFPHVEELRLDGKTKRWKLPAGAIAGLIQISAEDLTEMRTAIDLLKKEGLTHHAENLDKLWLKIKGKLHPKTAASIETDLEALLEAEGHAMRPGPRPRINAHVLYILREAIKGFCKVKLTYNGRIKNEVSERIVHPYGFIYGLRHYLIAWCEKSKGLRTFSLPNIVDISLLDMPYRKDPAFDLQKFAEQSFGVFQEEPYEVKLRFSAEVAEAAKSQHFHPTQQIEEQKNGSLIVKFKAGGQKEICWYLMTWEGEVEVLGPDCLKKAYRDMVKQLNKNIKS